MTESSRFWTTGTTGDGTSTYTQDQVMDWLRKMFLYDPTTQCVLKGAGNDLAVTGTASPISINTGAGYVYGFFYENTAAVTKTITTPVVGTTGFRVVLQATWGTTRTVRIAVLSSADGTPTAPAVTQTPGTLYEVSLATGTITTGGVIAITDDRHYVHPNMMVSTAMLDDLAVTTAKLASGAVTPAKVDSGYALIPTGGKFIGIFNVACPSGWTRVAAFDGKVLKGAATYGGTGGADTHTHTGPSHNHAGPSHTHTGPSHTHDQNVYTQTANQQTVGTYIVKSAETAAMMVSQGGGAITLDIMKAGVAAGGTGATGAEGTGATGAAGTGATGATSTWPPYVEVVFCSKD